MEKCKLCKQNLADKTGSHIVPHFLLKRVENIEGETGRDYELGFTITEFDTSIHFGRSVPVDKLEDIFEKIEDKDLENNNSPLITDNIFCSECETRLASIENEYAKTLSKFDENNYNSGIKNELALLFWISIIWRMSVNKKSGVTLTKYQDETLRRILNRSLNKKIENIDIENISNSRDLRKITYKLMRCPECSESNNTVIFFHPKFKNPYTLIIDEYILFFAFKNNYNDYLQKSFSSMKDDVFLAKTNPKQEFEEIFVINEQRLIDINSDLIQVMKNKRINKIDLFLNRLHKEMKGEGDKMPLKIRNEIFKEITSTEKKLGRKYNVDDLVKSTIKVMQKYAPIDPEIIKEYDIK